MLALSMVMEIDRLLQDGKLSQRQIAARLGVSRGSVAAIANGRRGLHGTEPPLDGIAAANSRARPERCPHCGYRVQLPCQICLTRIYEASRKPPATATNELGRRSLTSHLHQPQRQSAKLETPDKSRSKDQIRSARPGLGGIFPHTKGPIERTPNRR